MSALLGTIGGAVATGVTGAAAAVTFGQCEAINNACAASASYTADKACNTVFRHAGEAAVFGVATVGKGARCAMCATHFETKVPGVSNRIRGDLNWLNAAA